jgi:predicted TIM-barrel fold metal-dependent hydrolase
VIIDHLGRPLQGTLEEHDRVIGWSRYKNTVIKLSAIPPRTQFPHRDAAPAIRKAADAFGPDRMIYGGGFEANATPDSYVAARERLLAYVSHLSPPTRTSLGRARRPSCSSSRLTRSEQRPRPGSGQSMYT